ncbi:hypothetical protein QN395_06365 [Undibacterium sp. RTI2.2]|nr:MULTISPECIES: hypothetical protein [unclassified Undibacterium]MDY7539450.1 hypothetical protein [Undibacterium sp. 5I1]MEB0116103.1 hypothetical protein [Undibacterium sp. RTI2.2]MEB0230709.1 hypothetical protein [Undibacterium sp. 10I3]MEB0259661.1 hypothetical protein [Undibacterium sp. 5I1]
MRHFFETHSESEAESSAEYRAVLHNINWKRLLARTTPLAITATSTVLFLSACGGGSADPTASTAQNAAAVSSAGTSDTVSTPDASSAIYSAAIAAAQKSAATDPLCAVSKLGDFYWEIGNSISAKPIASGSLGTGSVVASSYFNIASASKWIFGAYVVEKKGIESVRNTVSLSDGLRFLSGYTGLNDTACAGTGSVNACFIAGMNGNTSQPDPTTVGKFDYDGGHDQKLAAIDLGLGNFTAAQLTAEYQNTPGLSKGFNMAPLDPLMAGGMMGTATDYALFLRKMMNQQLVIGSHLGENAVCTLPGNCPGKVAYSPIVALQEPWTYSYNHWVESQYGNGSIDAYSSPGKWGFYPWISSDKKYYGIVSRHDTNPTAYAVSVLCGRQIRKAFLGAL